MHVICTSTYSKLRVEKENDFHRLVRGGFFFFSVFFLFFFYLWRSRSLSLFLCLSFTLSFSLVHRASRQPRGGYFCKDLYLAETYSKSSLHRVTGRNHAGRFCFVNAISLQRKQTSRVEKKETPLQHAARIGRCIHPLRASIRLVNSRRRAVRLVARACVFIRNRKFQRHKSRILYTVSWEWRATNFATSLFIEQNASCGEWEMQEWKYDVVEKIIKVFPLLLFMRCIIFRCQRCTRDRALL